MHMTTTLAALLALCCDLCAPIRVPIAWGDGEVTKESKGQFAVESLRPRNAEHKPVPLEYFEYTAKKPQFAVDVAASHGVQSPEKHFKANPIKPHTIEAKPHFGVHHILQGDKAAFQPFQKFIKSVAVPVSSNYEVFHPYKAEEPALQEIYRDPVLTKIRDDLENNKIRLQNTVNKAGESDITKDEYLESPKQTDKKLFPQANYPLEFEIHKPQRRPVYYRLSQKHSPRDQILNKKLKHPWNQNYVKIKPVHYYPLQNHIRNLRQHHAAKYDDEHNEYPQVQDLQKHSTPSEGYDIYEKGKQKYELLRNHVDESIDKAVRENKPAAYHEPELKNDEDSGGEKDVDDEEDEFVPIKNYAQVRKTESIKHLPREAALEDAETYEEIRNAPRLREAVKSTKAQTVYTEEGYEDSAYDHAGEQKHASDHEGHGGFLRQKEVSGGKFKIPTFVGNHDDGEGSEYKDQVVHSKKWKNDDKDFNKNVDAENYTESEQEYSAEAIDSEESNRNKRENNDKSDTMDQYNYQNETAIRHAEDKGEVVDEIPHINLSSIFLNEKEMLEIAKPKVENENDEIKDKYPYYFNHLKSISKNSPLRYAENFKLIPKKSKGGTEFYDSRSKLECPEVEDVDPISEKVNDSADANDNGAGKKKENNKGEDLFDTVQKQPRLKNLGDKIDCFKVKYFGENPLDSPFFKEDLIMSPEPVTIPNLPTYKLDKLKEHRTQDAQASAVVEKIDELRNEGRTDVFVLLDKLKNDQNQLYDSVATAHDQLRKSVKAHHNSVTPKTELSQESNIYNDILDNIKKQHKNQLNTAKNYSSTFDWIDELKHNQTAGNETYVSYKNKEDVTKAPQVLRKKRSTSFVYEPYKIIRESQSQDSKKTTTSSNISPLIKQMQSNRVVDRVTRANQEPEKRRISKVYKDIGKSDREKNTEMGDEVISESSFVDVNIDERRGEPRYEIKHQNHKSEYTPVGNKKAITLEDYRNQKNTGKNLTEINTAITMSPIQRTSRQRRPSSISMFDVSEFLPIRSETQNVAASNTIRRTMTTIPPSNSKSTASTIVTSDKSVEDDESGEEYEDYEDDEDEETEEQTLTTTTTTTQKPTLKRRRIVTTTVATHTERTTELSEPKLRLVTRFRGYNPDQHKKQMHSDHTESTEKQKLKEMPHRRDSSEIDALKYREKKNKSSKSTIVTDTKKYGDDNDGMKEEELDAMIGVKHDIKEYMPEYEKQNKQKYKDSSEEDYEDSLENFDDDDEDNTNEEEAHDEEEEVENNEKENPIPTTPEPTKRTLVRTTDAPTPTVASHNTKIVLKPVISRKKIEIHKELPVDKTSPHVTQFKQDIKEVEVIKEVTPAPKRHLKKQKEALELYKDDRLAKEINNLGDVEVFKENLDLENSPRHGGNYRSIEDVTESNPIANLQSKVPKDAVASQSENTRHNIELDEYSPRRMHGGNLKSIGDIPKSRSNHNSKFTDPGSNTNSRNAMRSGNAQLDSRPSRGRNKFERLEELTDDSYREDYSKDENYKNVHNNRRGQAMHGGNYRSAKIVQADSEKSEENDYDIRVRPDKSQDAGKDPAVLLNSFAQAIPILTTTPAYILDPSKRMYYYVEA
ncbi:myb-like protein X [Bombyx mori]|uniref:Cuticle protein n=1 Tax=Bombyx mori TaxID=7091 RepID=A0A8R2HQ49_BOMMO|nr:myb-like protein X [Bombyx mori]